jgi:itaconate CoA-transferase
MVVALEQAVALPFCSWMLAELGANVVKIERPGSGDVVRGWDNVVGGLSTGFVWVNGGKRDIAVDLGSEDGRTIVRRLALNADVFVENFAPGVAARVGLSAETLRSEQPQLIHCSLSGYGQTGPYRDLKAYDLLIQGESGILLTNGTLDAPAKVGLPLTDLIGGSTAATAILSALYRRQATGKGATLDVGMLDSVLPWLGYFPHHWWHTETEPPRSGMRHQYLCPYGPYLAEDGRYVNLVVASTEHWKRFCGDIVRRPEWLADPRFVDIEARKVNRDALEELVEKAVADEPSATWIERLRVAGLPYGEVRSISEVVSHPQVEARRMVVMAESPIGEIPLVRSPLAPVDAPRRIPALGEDTVEVLREVGYVDEEIEAFVARGVVAGCS